MFCKKCGNELNENDAFCGKCGAPVQAASVIPSSVKSKSEKSLKNRNKAKKAVIITLSLLIVVSIISAIVFLPKSKLKPGEYETKGLYTLLFAFNEEMLNRCYNCDHYISLYTEKRSGEGKLDYNNGICQTWTLNGTDLTASNSIRIYRTTDSEINRLNKENKDTIKSSLATEYIVSKNCIAVKEAVFDKKLNLKTNFHNTLNYKYDIADGYYAIFSMELQDYNMTCKVEVNVYNSNLITVNSLYKITAEGTLSLSENMIEIILNNYKFEKHGAKGETVSENSFSTNGNSFWFYVADDGTVYVNTFRYKGKNSHQAEALIEPMLQDSYPITAYQDF